MEIRKKNCDKCKVVMESDPVIGSFENMLTVVLDGGYMEYVDEIYSYPEETKLKFYLCHKCAHEMVRATFGDRDFTGWHPNSGDEWCDGYSSDTVGT